MAESEAGAQPGTDAGRPANSADPYEQARARLRDRLHSRCVVCGAESPLGLHVPFHARQDGSIEAIFSPRAALQGYSNRLHGGVIAALLDGAMTNCLFAHGVVAVTGDLTIRYRLPVSVDEPFVVRAQREKGRSPLHHLTAELEQAGTVRVVSRARFVEVVAGPAPLSGGGISHGAKPT